jgi:L-ascorbate metabolism protein UlaG (beta-lactamase superfamily)
VKRAAKAAAVAAGAFGTAVVLDQIFATRPYDGPVSDHFDGERFHNPDRNWQREGDFLKWIVNRDRGFWPKWVDATHGEAPPRRVDDLRVTFINHSTTLIQVGGINILTDPVYSHRVSPVAFAGPKRHRAPGIRFKDLPPIDLVLVSHNHYDHLDVATLRRLQDAHGPRIITPLGNGSLMRRNGVRNAIELDWWERFENVTVVPAQHFSARALSDRNYNLWGGFVVSSDRGNIYFAGDSGWGSHFEEIGRRFAPIRLALLPIGAYLPRWFMRPAHIEPAEAVRAHQALNADTSVAIHFGTFALGDDGELEPVRDLQRAIEAGGSPRFWILNHGEGRDVPACEPSALGHTASSTT